MGDLWNATVSSWSVCKTCNICIAAHCPQLAEQSCPQLTAYTMRPKGLGGDKAGSRDAQLHWQSSHTICTLYAVHHM